MNLDYELFIELGVFIASITGVYWRMYYNQKNIQSALDRQERKNTLFFEKHDHHEEEITRMERKIYTFERRWDRKLTNIEKILIKIDERMRTGASGDLISDDDE